MKFVEVTHSTLGTKIWFLPTQVWSIYTSDSTKSTHIVSTAGNLVTAKESVEEIKEAVISALGQERSSGNQIREF